MEAECQASQGRPFRLFHGFVLSLAHSVSTMGMQKQSVAYTHIEIHQEDLVVVESKYQGCAEDIHVHGCHLGPLGLCDSSQQQLVRLLDLTKVRRKKWSQKEEATTAWSLNNHFMPT
eukprot:6045068-Amphidinium_carterae.1